MGRMDLDFDDDDGPTSTWLTCMDCKQLYSTKGEPHKCPPPQNAVSTLPPAPPTLPDP